ncbi:plexin-C1-like isoform X1 [Centropristis striata]|uniref:plexin-C1-like isoform X1 n=1 Tax=Centropristis striata TaxID=184440 RepID=UPI0027E03831|nr:plexin-C1-like isoform X1 [Centropristis striata]
MLLLLLPALLLVLWGAPARCLEENGAFTFDGDIRLFTVANNTVYVATEETLYQLSHDLTLVHSHTQRGILTSSFQTNIAHFSRVSEKDKENATFRVNILLPFVENKTVISCGVIECGYCEVLDLNNISNVLYTEHVLVGSPWHNSSSVGFLVNVERVTNTETYILAATEQRKDMSTKTSCLDPDEVSIHNTNNKQSGELFSAIDYSSRPKITSTGSVEFVDGFQLNSIIYLLSNVPSSDKSNKVRLIWLQGRDSKTQTLASLRGATLSISDGGGGSRLISSSVIPGGPPVLWSGVFSVDGGPTNTELLLFDISPDLTGATDGDPDFCRICPGKTKPVPKTLKPKTVLFRQSYMTSVLAVRHKAWMVFFIGTGDGQLIKLAVDKNYETTCPRVLYRASDDRQLFPKMHLDQVDLKHVYMPFQNQMMRVPVSKCSTYTSVQDCWSAQDPYCVWCSSKRRCIFEDECPDSDWISIPDDSQQKMVSYSVVKEDTGQITLNIQTHLTGGQKALDNFACQFSSTATKPCSTESRPQFPRCSCTLSSSTLPAEGLGVTVKIRLETTLSEDLKLSNCSDIRGPPSSVLCRQCIKAGCGWSSNGCSWANQGLGNDGICQKMESMMNFSKPQISSIAPSVVSFYGRNHAVLSGSNLRDVTRVRIQEDMDCTPKESPVWNNTGVSLTFHIPSADNKGVVQVCVVLQDGSCHGSAKINYRSSPSCTNITPRSSWASGKRKITLIGSHLEFVEGVVHSHALQEVKPPRNSSYQYLTYESPAAEKGISTSTVSLKVANETLSCSTIISYYPDPEFTAFTAIKTGADVRISIQKKADQLEMSPAEVSVWGVEDGKQYPCIIEVKETSEDLFICQIKNTSDNNFQQLKITYGDKTVTLGELSLSLLHKVILTLRIVLIPFIIFALVIICLWQKKLTAEMNQL